MAALQCPDCGHREDLAVLGNVASFSCDGCGRALKVPAQFRPAATVAETAAPQEPARQPDWREVYPLDTAASREAAAAAAERRPLAWWARGLIWLVALPFSLAVVFGLSHSFGWLTRDDLVSTLTDVGWDRFVPVARLLPVAALLTAVLVQGSVLMLEMLRDRRARRQPNPSPS